MHPEDLDRWVGIVAALGVLLPLAIWLAYDSLGERARTAVAVTSALVLVLAMGGAVGRMSIVGLVAGEGQVTPFTGEGRRALVVVLALGGLAAGLAASLALRARGEAGPAGGVMDGAVDGWGDDLDDEPFEGRAETLASGPDETGQSRRDGAAPRTLPGLPFGRPAATLLLVALALALPLDRFGARSSFALLRIANVDASGVMAALVAAFHLGLALLLPALALRRRDTWAVVAVFSAVAFGQGLATAWPEATTNQLWFMFGCGLSAGLLVPLVLRLLTPSLVTDAAAVAIGVLVVVGLVAAQTALYARAASRTVDSRFESSGSP